METYPINQSFRIFKKKSLIANTAKALRWTWSKLPQSVRNKAPQSVKSRLESPAQPQEYKPIWSSSVQIGDSLPNTNYGKTTEQQATITPGIQYSTIL